jgi:hypothetical protein
VNTGAEEHWVEIGLTILEAGERTANLPEDTKLVPYYVRIRGFATTPVDKGDFVEIETLIGRRIAGEVLRVQPAYGHDFGEPIEELLQAGREARARLVLVAEGEAGRGHAD